MTTINELIRAIEGFIEERKESKSGECSEVTKDEIFDLSEIIYAIISLKYEENVYGDFPVRFKIWDETKYRMPPFSEHLHPHLVKTENEKKKLIDTLIHNVAVASSDLDMSID